MGFLRDGERTGEWRPRLLESTDFRPVFSQKRAESVALPLNAKLLGSADDRQPGRIVASSPAFRRLGSTLP
jgi:hypothetical protein